jgi:hypothetical protein
VKHPVREVRRSDSQCRDANPRRKKLTLQILAHAKNRKAKS